MEKIMRVWAKISSLGIVLFAIYGIIFGIYLTNKLLSFPITYSMGTLLLFVVFINLLYVAIFSPPLFYFGWVKKPKNKEMKLWAKVLTILLPILLVLGFISPWGLELTDIPSTIPSILIIVPLYYYGWRD